jgi:hypothetical protein
MDSLTPPRPPLKEDSFELSPLLPITIEIASPFEQSIRLSATSTPLPPSPLEPMEAYELYCLAENSDDISEILELLEPNNHLLRTWSYFQHCQHTAHKLEKEARFQRNLADSLLGELRQLRIDEILRPVIVKARRQEERTTHYARPSLNTFIRPPNPIPTTTNSTNETTMYSTEEDFGGPSHPIIVVDDETTPTSSSSASSPSSLSAPSSKKRRGPELPRRTSRYVRRMTTGLPNLGSSV